MPTKLIWTEKLPFGFTEIKKDAAIRYKENARHPLIGKDWVECCIEGCTERFLRRSRSVPAHCCPKHRISISSRPAYVYERLTDNLIVGKDLYKQLPHKVDPRRLNSESSEDAVSWNVFVGIHTIGELGSLYRLITGDKMCEDIRLYLWGNRIDTDSSEFWTALNGAQKRIEPKKARKTEPDIILHVPGRALLIIEAKFGSPNSLLEKKCRQVGTASEYFSSYLPQSPSTDPLNRTWIYVQNSGVLEQLCRNVMLGHWLAGAGERFILANLVRKSDEVDVESRFSNHLNPGTVQFMRITWEQIYAMLISMGSKAAILRRYIETKTLGLSAAFDVAANDG